MIEPECIAVAAILSGGITMSMERPKRHSDLINALAQLTGGNKASVIAVEGFLTNRGRFVSRHLAAQIAVKAGQIDKLRFGNGTQLFSEDLW